MQRELQTSYPLITKLDGMPSAKFEFDARLGLASALISKQINARADELLVQTHTAAMAIETTDEGKFKALLSKYKKSASTQGMIDIKSGLKLYNAMNSSK
jgi:hypothetical protein